MIIRERDEQIRIKEQLNKQQQEGIIVIIKMRTRARQNKCIIKCNLPIKQ